jgi:hypothetical protein
MILNSLIINLAYLFNIKEVFRECFINKNHVLNNIYS